jgi:hypothetical protein
MIELLKGIKVVVVVVMSDLSLLCLSVYLRETI